MRLDVFFKHNIIQKNKKSFGDNNMILKRNINSYFVLLSKTLKVMNLPYPKISVSYVSISSSRRNRDFKLGSD